MLDVETVENQAEEKLIELREGERELCGIESGNEEEMKEDLKKGEKPYWSTPCCPRRERGRKTLLFFLLPQVYVFLSREKKEIEGGIMSWRGANVLAAISR